MSVHNILKKITAAQNAGHGPADFSNEGIKADVIAESTAAAGVTADGVLLKDGDVTAGSVTADIVSGALYGSVVADTVAASETVASPAITATADSTTGEIAVRIGDTTGGGLGFYRIEKAITLSTAAASAITLFTVPKHAKPLTITLNLNAACSAEAGSGAAKLGIGLSQCAAASAIRFGFTSALTKNVKITKTLNEDPFTSAIGLKVFAVSAGTTPVAKGKVGKAGCTATVSMTYLTVEALPNVA